MKILFNDLGLDEIVFDNSFIHMERINDKSFWLNITDKNTSHMYYIEIFIENNILKAKIEGIYNES